MHDNTNLWLMLIQIWPPQDASWRFPSDNFTAKRCTQVTRYHAYSYHLTRILSFLMFSDNFLTFLRKLLCVYRGIYNILPFSRWSSFTTHILSLSMNIILTIFNYDYWISVPTIYPFLPYLILLATSAPGFHLLTPNLHLLYAMVSSTQWNAFCLPNHAHLGALPHQSRWKYSI